MSTESPARKPQPTGIGIGMGLPRGSRDLLPPSFRQRRAVTGALLETFERWGYEPVATPLVEYYDVVSRGLTEADRRLCVRFIEAGSGAVVALRSDLTPQIARMVAEHAHGALADRRPLRLCYAADVVRQGADEREQTEYHQVGVELIGAGDAHADAETIALCHAALCRAGLSDFRLDLSHRQVAAAMLECLGLSQSDQGSVVALLARKNRGAVADRLAELGVSASLRDTVASMCDLYGPPHEVLARAAPVAEKIGAQPAVARLEEVLDILAAIEPQAHARVDLDLGETRGFDYYTGLRLRAWAPGVSGPLCRGGRYDDLLARYGAPHPATGFAIDLDALESALRATGRTVENGGVATRIIGVHPQADSGARRTAASLAAAARSAGERAFVVTAQTLEETQILGDQSSVDHVAHVGAGSGGPAEVAHAKRTKHGWKSARGPSAPPTYPPNYRGGSGPEDDDHNDGRAS